MATTTISSREFNQDTGRAKKASEQGPVIITDRGRPVHVLLSIEEYERLTARRRSLVESLAMPGLSELEFEPSRSREDVRAADLSS